MSSLYKVINTNGLSLSSGNTVLVKQGDNYITVNQMAEDIGDSIADVRTLASGNAIVFIGTPPRDLSEINAGDMLLKSDGSLYVWTKDGNRFYPYFVEDDKTNEKDWTEDEDYNIYDYDIGYEYNICLTTPDESSSTWQWSYTTLDNIEEEDCFFNITENNLKQIILNDDNIEINCSSLDDNTPLIIRLQKWNENESSWNFVDYYLLDKIVDTNSTEKNIEYRVYLKNFVISEWPKDNGFSNLDTVVYETLVEEDDNNNINKQWQKSNQSCIIEATEPTEKGLNTFTYQIKSKDNSILYSGVGYFYFYPDIDIKHISCTRPSRNWGTVSTGTEHFFKDGDCLGRWVLISYSASTRQYTEDELVEIAIKNHKNIDAFYEENKNVLQNAIINTYSESASDNIEYGEKKIALGFNDADKRIDSAMKIDASGITQIARLQQGEDSAEDVKTIVGKNVLNSNGLTITTTSYNTNKNSLREDLIENFSRMELTSTDMNFYAGNKNSGEGATATVANSGFSMPKGIVSNEFSIGNFLFSNKTDGGLKIIVQKEVQS